MLSQADLQIALAFALREFGPAWKIVSDCLPVDPLDPNHWASGSHSFRVTLRHRMSGQVKAIGRRVVDEPDATPHRGLGLSLIEAYGHGNAEPLRRYLEEVGVAAGPPRDAAAQFFRRPEGAPAPAGAVDDSRDAAAMVAEPAVALAASVAAVAPVASPDSATRRAARPPIPSAERRIAAGRPKWRWRREVPPPLARPSRGSVVPPTTPASKQRVLSRLRRELEIWQWRRTVISSSRKNGETE